MNTILESTEMPEEWNTSTLYMESVNQSVSPFTEQTPILENSTAVTSDSFQTFVTLSWVFISPTLTLVGLFGNILTIIIMKSKEFSNLNSRLFLIALAFSDSIFVIVQPFNKMPVRNVIGIDIRAVSDVGCQIFFWFCKTSKLTSSWIIVAICVERFIAVFRPLQARIICAKRTAIITLLTIYLGIGTLNAVFTFSSHIKNGICSPDVVTTETALMYRGFILSVLSIYSIIPITILLTLTPVIIYKVFNRPAQRSIGNVLHSSKHMMERFRITSMLLGIVLVYIICVIPITILHISAHFWKVGVFTKGTKQFAVFREIAQICELINYSINFWLYVITSSQFRKRFCEILGCRREQETSGKRETPTPRDGY